MTQSILARILLLFLCCCVAAAPRAVAITPLPLEPLLIRVVPADAVLCVHHSGFTAPDASSANQTEQLAAEPEVQRFLKDVDQLIGSLLEKIPAANSDGPNREQAQLIYYWAQQVLPCPWTIYLGNLRPSPDGGPPQFEAAWLVKLDDQLAAARELIHQLLGDRVSQLELETIAGVTCDRWQPKADAPPIFFGSRGKYLLITVGEDSMSNLMARVQAQPPAWLAEMARETTVPRKSLMARVDLSRINQLIEQLAPPDFQNMWTACGLSGTSTAQLLKGLDDQGTVVHGSLQASSWTGLLSLLDVSPLSKEELQMIPPDVLRAFAWRLSPAQVMSIIESLVATADPEGPAEMEADLERFAAQTGLRVREDLLEPLGDFGCFFQSPGGFMGIPNATLVVSLRDAGQFEKTHTRLRELLEAALANASKGGRNMKLAQTPIGDRTVHYVTGMPISPSWCVTESHLVVAISTMSLQGYLSRDAKGPGLVDKSPISEQLGAGNGPLCLSYLNTPQVLDGVYRSLPMLMGMVSGQLQQAGVELNPSLLPKWEDIRDHLGPSVTSLRRTPTGVEFNSQATLPGGSLFSGSAPVAVALLLPAVQAARTAARRVESMNNLRQLELAILNYVSVRHQLPAPALATKGGPPGLSWRVAVLPYLGETNLYHQFHLDEPWDSPHNKTLLGKMPAVYRSRISSLDGGMTTYLAVVGNDAALGDPAGTQSTRLRDITDGTSNTVMLVEVNDDRAVPWTKPDDYVWNPENPTSGLDDTYAEVFLAARVDGSVAAFPLSTPGDTLKAMFTKSGGEVIPAVAP